MKAIFIFLTACFTAFSQQEEAIEEYFENTAKDNNDAPQTEIIDHFRERPFNLYDPDISNLEKLGIFDRSEIEILIEFIESHQKTFKYSMITDSIGFSPEQELILEACSEYNEVHIPKNYGFTLRSRAIDPLESSYGKLNDNFTGKDAAYYSRLSGYYDKFEMNLLAATDQGEAAASSFKSGYIKYRKDDLSVTAGDFYLKSGMGLIYSGVFGPRKGSGVYNSMFTSNTYIKDYRSSMENGFFRGIAAEKQFTAAGIKNKISGFYSNRDLSGNIEGNTAYSISKTGYFRTDTELDRKNNLKEKAAGFSTVNQFENTSLGFNFLNLNYDKTINTNSSTDISGSSQNFFSGFLSHFTDKYSTGMEVVSDQNGFGAFSGYLFILKKKMKIILNARYFDPNFRSPFGNTFSENSYIANEKGIYIGINSKLSGRTKLKAYADFFETMQPTYFIPYPVKGMELFSQLEYRISTGTELLIRSKYESKTDAVDDHKYNREFIGNGNKYNVRLELSKKTGNLYTRIRTEYTKRSNRLDPNSSEGILASLELKYRNSPVKLHTRITFFDTGSYDSAIWQFEYIMPGYMSTVPLYGQGTRFYAGGEVRILNFLELNLRYDITFKNNENTIGSSYYKVKGSHKSRLILQAEIDL